MIQVSTMACLYLGSFSNGCRASLSGQPGRTSLSGYMDLSDIGKYDLSWNTYYCSEVGDVDHSYVNRFRRNDSGQI